VHWRAFRNHLYELVPPVVTNKGEGIRRLIEEHGLVEAEPFWRRGSKFVCPDNECQRLSSPMRRRSTEPSIADAEHLLFSTRGAVNGQPE
jgi:hypothetical protein